MKSRKETKEPTWNLNDLFRGMNDPKLEAAVRTNKRLVDGFRRRHRGKVARQAGRPESCLRMLEQYEKVLVAISKPLIYSHLLFAESNEEQARRAFLQQMQTTYNDLFRELIFFELELLDLVPAALKKLIRHKKLERFSNYLQRLLDSKPHRLSEREEQLLSDKSLTGRQAFIRLFNEELSLKRFPMRYRGKTKEYSETELLDMISDPNRELRKAAAAAFSAGLRQDSRRLSYIFNTLGQDKAVDDRHLRFDNPEASRHLANEIDQKTVDVMTDVITKAYELVSKYYSFKAKVLGVKKLYDYDRYAPIAAGGERYSFSTAKELVLNAFYEFSDECGRNAEAFFKGRWIDAPVRRGKRGGAFCSFVTPDVHPYVLVNYKGKLQDVTTLAHELGHGIHACFMRDAGYLNYETPLTIAETASVFAEMLLFDELRERVKDKRERLSMYAAKMESIFATVFRQVCMYRFEQDFHKARREQGELPASTINQLWRNRQREMFGKSVELTPDYDYWWSYIPHFVHTPFYVYAYAFGELLTLALYAQYKREGEKFVPLYIEMLKAGSSKSPANLLKPLGVDLKKRSFWQQGISLIEELLGGNPGAPEVIVVVGGGSVEKGWGFAVW